MPRMSTVMRWPRALVLLVVVFLAASVAQLATSSTAQAAQDSAGHTAFTYAGTWSADGTSHWSNAAGATATATVDVGAGGGTITVRGNEATWMGYAKVQVDSSTPLLRDLYNGTLPVGTQTQVDLVTTPKLAEGRHTVKVTVTGTKNPAAVDTYVVIAAVSTSNGVVVSQTPPATTQPTLTATAPSVGDGTATLAWDYTAGTDAAAVDQIRVGRNGTDTNGNGPWSIVRPVADGTQQFTLLANGTTYTLYAEMLKNGAVVGTRQNVQVTPTGGTAPPPTGGGTAGAWLSGGAGSGIDGGDTSFGTWRGRPVQSMSTWADSQEACENQWGLSGSGPLANWSGPAVVAIGGKWGQSWSSAATGGMDGIWTNCLNAMKAAWGSRAQANLYISLFHEANGNWYEWSVGNGDVASFKAAFARFENLQEAILPDANLMFVLNAENVGNSYSMSSLLPDPADFDVLGVDQYSMHSSVNFDQFPALAASVGKSLVVQEWGIKNDEGGGAAFVQYMRDKFVQYGGTGVGKVIMENYFNISEYQIYPGTSSPQGAQRYRDLW